MALYLLLDTFYDGTFSSESYAFRRGRGQKDAIFKCDEILREGYDIALDLDIKSFFDSVDHKLMMEVLMRNITDKAILATINTYLKTKVVYGHHIYRKYLGLSQGSPLSPLLANIYLNEFDTFLTRKGLRFLRYADDIVVFFHGLNEANSCKTKIERFLEENCRLQVNQDKTKIVTFGNISFLGYTWYRDDKGHLYMDLDSKVQEKIYAKMKMHINKENPGSSKWWDLQGAFNRGWVNYYRYIDEDRLVQFLNEAEEKQYRLISEKIYKNREDDLESLYTAGLNESKQFTGLIEWFNYING